MPKITMAKYIRSPQYLECSIVLIELVPMLVGCIFAIFLRSKRFNRFTNRPISKHAGQ